MALIAQSLNFRGLLLKRGFWLYVWQIRAPSGTCVYYIGRTGDNSTATASSPLNRAGMHYDTNPKAKGKRLIHRIQAQGWDPEQCEYRLAAVGPLFREESTLQEHKPIRNVVATLEHAVAENFRSRGLSVLGVHHASKKAPLDQSIFSEALQAMNDALFPASANAPATNQVAD